MTPDDDFYSSLSRRLDQRKSENRFRSLTTVEPVGSAALIRIDGKGYINFSSNDYLGLSNHPKVLGRSIDYVKSYGAGSASSRLISGSLKAHAGAEKKLGDIYHGKSSLLFNSGFQANATILPALTEKRDWILADKLVHNSLLTGAMSSRASLFRFRHNDLNHLRTFLKRSVDECRGTVWIVTESLFSMDGDTAPVKELCELAKQFDARIYLDDAHAIGVCGNGMGFGELHPEIDIIVGTFGKAGGSFGAFIVADSIVIDACINFCSGFIYSTALPPAVTGAIDAALDLIPDMIEERNHLNRLSEYLHSELKKTGLITSEKPSHILPVIMGTEEAVQKMSKKLLANGIFTTAIRPPTVPKNSSRIRLSLTADHSQKDCDKLLEILRKS